MSDKYETAIDQVPSPSVWELIGAFLALVYVKVRKELLILLPIILAAIAAYLLPSPYRGMETLGLLGGLVP